MEDFHDVPYEPHECLLESMIGPLFLGIAAVCAVLAVAAAWALR